MHAELTRTLARSRRCLELTALGVLLALVGAAGTFLALWAPGQRPAPRRVALASRLSLGYAGRARPGSLYGPGGLRGGEPIIFTMASRVVLVVRYRLDSVPPAAAAGTLTAGIALRGDGLTVALGPPARAVVSGRQATLHLPLPTAAYRSALSHLDALDGAGSYPLVVEARVAGHVTTEGRVLPLATRAGFAFQASAAQLTPGAGSSGAVPGGGSAPASAGLSHTSLEQVTVASVARRGLRVLGVAVARSRALGVAAAVLVLGALLAVWPLRRYRRIVTAERRVPALLRWAHLMTEVDDLGMLPPAEADVGWAHQLVRLARTLELPVLAWHGPEVSQLAVRDGQLTYRFALGHPTAGTPGETWIEAAQTASPAVSP